MICNYLLPFNYKYVCVCARVCVYYSRKAIHIITWMTNESRLFSAPSESYLPSKGSLVPSIDDCTYTRRDVTNVCHKGPTIAATEWVGRGENMNY